VRLLSPVCCKSVFITFYDQNLAVMLKFTVFATDDMAVVSFNECLLGAGQARDDSEHGIISCARRGDDQAAPGDVTEVVAPTTILRMRFDSGHKHRIEASHVRKNKSVCHFV
jgi:hypothetical protein